MVLCYSRNKCATVVDREDGSLLVRAGVEDTLFTGAVEMVVRVPDLEIVSVEGEVRRAFHEECREATSLLHEAVGLRIGSGVNKAINDLVGGPKGCPRLADLMLECVDQVILRFTFPRIKEVQSVKEEDRVEATREMLRQNPALLGSCVAFAPGSSLLRDLEIQR